jgi:hypothetical protein
VDSPAGYIFTLFVGIAGTYLSQFVLPKIKILFWVSHDFLYSVPINQHNPQQQQQALPPPAQQLPLPQVQPQNFVVRTQSIVVQNFGRKSAEWVDIVHRTRPDFFQLYPSLNYKESMTPAGEHVLRLNSVSPKEWFTLQTLSYLTPPELLYIKSPAGYASAMQWMTVRRYPQWVYIVTQLLIGAGAGICTYEVVKGVKFLLKLLHVM